MNLSQNMRYSLKLAGNDWPKMGLQSRNIIRIILKRVYSVNNVVTLQTRDLDSWM